MKYRFLAAGLLSTWLAIAACGADSGHHAASETVSTDTAEVIGESGLADIAGNDDHALSLNDPARKVIKTADLRCRVTDVFAATTHLERLAYASGGQIADSRLDNVTDDKRSLPYKTDSLREVESYTTTAHLTLRIPVAQLDTVLTDIAAQSAFVHTRSLKLDDVTLRYLGNKLKNEAQSTGGASKQAQALARRSADAVSVGQYADERAETRIDRRIENLQLSDQAAYATLTVDLYQPQRVAFVIVPDTALLMKPGFGQQVLMALNNGWLLLRALMIGLLHIWPLLLIAAAAILIYRRRSGRGFRKTAGV